LRLSGYEQIILLTVKRIMTSEKPPITIKKYANRRLYNTQSSTYVTLEDLAELVQKGEDFVVLDARSGEDLTRTVLTQIIFEQENKGQNLLPVTFLRQLISFYGNSVQALVPSFLDFSISNFSRRQQEMREHMASTLGPSSFQKLEEQVRTNMAFFSDAMRMFTPFAGASTGQQPPSPTGSPVSPSQPANEDLDRLRQQMAEMQKQLEALAKKQAP
jgi:polyhydroxyalkanoate synthesis repressor PhaR